jgi:hypothetical protein
MTGLGVGGGHGHVEIVVDDLLGHVFFGESLDVLEAVEGFEGGVHEVGKAGDLAVVDIGEGEGLGDGVDVFHDRLHVCHVDEGDEGHAEVAGAGEDGAGAGHKAAMVVIETELLVVLGGHGAAGSGEAEMAATLEGGHGGSFLRESGRSLQPAACSWNARFGRRRKRESLTWEGEAFFFFYLIRSEYQV